VTAGNWNHVAITINATDAALWVASETGPYLMLDSLASDFAGAGGEVIFAEPLGWSIGRGMFNNSVADWSDALIDEARISDVVLTPDQFLFAAVPEPATVAMAVVALGVVGLRRRRVGG
jgi:hypothetical protein